MQNCLQVTAATHRGKRESNQDNLRVGTAFPTADADPFFRRSAVFSAEELQVFCVCDGIGGGSRGDAASLAALTGVEDALSETALTALPLPRLAQAIAQQANEQVCELYRRLGSAGGCTLTLLVVRDHRFALLNIGDSPAFLWKKDTRKLTELTCRHNLQWHKRRLGLPATPEDACCLMRYLGRADMGAARMSHLVSGELSDGDQILLCSDGVTDAWTEEQLSNALETRIHAAALVDAAAEIPYADNSTAIVVTARYDKSEL